MRILHLLYDSPHNPWIGGGAAIRAHQVYRRFPQEFEINIVSGGYANCPREESHGNFLVSYGPETRSAIGSGLQYMLKSHQRLSKDSYDLVVEDFSPFTPCFSPIFARAPVVTLMQNIFGKHLVARYGLAGTVPALVEATTRRLHSNFLFVSPLFANWTKKFQNKMTAIIPNGVEDELLKLEPNDEGFLLFIGRLERYQKGLDLMIEALANGIDHEFDVVIAGDGPDHLDLKQRIESKNLARRIRMIGRVSENEKRDLLRRCSAVIVPSRFEAWSLVALEAAASCKPVIGFAIPGINGIVKSGITGVLARPFEINQLSTAISHVMNDHYLRRKLGKEARKEAKEFTWTVVAKRQLEFYEQVRAG
uniref:Glycosyl transferase family n=1 Tax=uncultured marine thaumarchaeote KM3_74_C10 TaxID=1456270 RepID=A0A075HMK6_9ARCH|nr:glycosyl transferase family [uncultured marine thaumarchaeote KM3_74_C10]